MALVSFVPEMAGVVIFVMPSVLDLPVSLAALSFGTEGAAGAAVSTMTAIEVDTGPRLPATSVFLVVMVWVASVKVFDVSEYVVVAAVTLATGVAPSYNVTR